MVPSRASLSESSFRVPQSQIPVFCGLAPSVVSAKLRTAPRGFPAPRPVPNLLGCVRTRRVSSGAYREPGPLECCRRSEAVFPCGRSRATRTGSPRGSDRPEKGSIPLRVPARFTIRWPTSATEMLRRTLSWGSQRRFASTHSKARTPSFFGGNSVGSTSPNTSRIFWASQ
jgi:hypothetical protein